MKKILTLLLAAALAVVLAGCGSEKRSRWLGPGWMNCASACAL